MYQGRRRCWDVYRQWCGRLLGILFHYDQQEAHRLLESTDEQWRADSGYRFQRIWNRLHNVRNRFDRSGDRCPMLPPNKDMIKRECITSFGHYDDGEGLLIFPRLQVKTYGMQMLLMDSGHHLLPLDGQQPCQQQLADKQSIDIPLTHKETQTSTRNILNTSTSQHGRNRFGVGSEQAQRLLQEDRLHIKQSPACPCDSFVPARDHGDGGMVSLQLIILLVFTVLFDAICLDIKLCAFLQCYLMPFALTSNLMPRGRLQCHPP